MNPRSRVLAFCTDVKRLVPAVLTIASLLCHPSGIVAQDAELEFFESRIRPVLAANCYECHNSSGRKEGELALDTRQTLRAGGPSGPLLDLQQPEASLLLAILRHEVDGLQMPREGAKLPDAVVQDFVTWIARGAVDPRDAPPTAEERAAAVSWESIRDQRAQWWSFQPVTDVPIPQVDNDNGADHPVDRFILRDLSVQGLSPSARATPDILIRRLFLTVIGLPPTVAEQAKWSAEFASDPHAAARLIDELLARPEFGERWARHWMDWIRYADSHGSEGDPPLPNAWRYRDYLIRALNADIPADRMIREHVAGDLLPDPRIDGETGLNESAIATAHWRMVFHGFAPVDALEERVRFTDDQVNAFTKAFLGLTVSCARCHNHKFDPISQADYYALFGVLNSCRPSQNVVSVETPRPQWEAELEQARQQLRRQVAAEWVKYGATFRRRLTGDPAFWQHADSPRWLLHPWRTVQQAAGVQGSPPGGTFADTWRKLVADWTANRAAREQFFRQSVSQRWDLRHNIDLPQWKRLGRGMQTAPTRAGEFHPAVEGEQIVSRILPSSTASGLRSQRDAARLESPDVVLPPGQTLWMLVAGESGARARYVVQNFPRDGTVYPVHRLGPEWSWIRLNVDYWKGDRIHVEFAHAMDGPLLQESRERCWFAVQEVVLQSADLPGPPDTAWVMLDPIFELAATKPPASADDLADIITTAFTNAAAHWQSGELTDAEALLLDACIAQNLIPNSLTHLPELRSSLESWRALEAETPVPARAPGVLETGAQDQPLLLRGDHKQPGEVIPRRFPEVLRGQPYGADHSGRLSLADDLTRMDNPLTRRVLVNRLWHHAFGRGLVRTPDNFGRLGLEPTHPELLDFLATRFAADGWSIKSMLRLLLTSRTWQQSSQPSPQAIAADPENRLWSHALVRRLEAEALRDSLLAATGGLDGTKFGPGVRGDSPRRGVYVEVRRNDLDPFLRTFDLPEPFSAVGQRDSTNVPAQFLIFLNDPRVRDLARQLATELSLRPQLTTDHERVREIYLRLLSRTADEPELAPALQFMNETRESAIRRQTQVHETQLKLSALDEESAAIRTLVLDRIGDRTSEVSTGADSVPPRVGQSAENGSRLPEPMAAWDFTGEQPLRDRIGDLDLELRGDARLEDGLNLDGVNSFAESPPLTAPLSQKTLVAVAQLENLDQRGGALLSVQNRDGVFDAIVFGELEPRHWMAGSDGFARTKSFGGPAEDAASREPVHIALVYASDGTTVAYRNGVPYGSQLQTQGLVSFSAKQSQLLFGLRHQPPSPDRLLKGRLVSAEVYATALNGTQVAELAAGVAGQVPESLILAAMSHAERQRMTEIKEQQNTLRGALRQLTSEGDDSPDIEALTELIRGLLASKEFLFLR